MIGSTNIPYIPFVYEGTIAPNTTSFTVTSPAITESSCIDDYYQAADGSIVTVRGRSITDGSVTITIKPKLVSIDYKIKVS